MSISAISFMSAPAKAPQTQQAVAKVPAESAANVPSAPAKKKGKGKIAALCIAAAGIAGIAYAAKKGKLKVGKAAKAGIVNDAEKVHAKIVANNQKYLDKANDILARKGDTLSDKSKKVLNGFIAKYQSRLA